MEDLNLEAQAFCAKAIELSKNKKFSYFIVTVQGNSLWHTHDKDIKPRQNNIPIDFYYKNYQLIPYLESLDIIDIVSSTVEGIVTYLYKIDLIKDIHPHSFKAILSEKPIVFVPQGTKIVRVHNQQASLWLSNQLKLLNSANIAITFEDDKPYAYDNKVKTLYLRKSKDTQRVHAVVEFSPNQAVFFEILFNQLLSTREDSITMPAHLVQKMYSKEAHKGSVTLQQLEDLCRKVRINKLKRSDLKNQVEIFYSKKEKNFTLSIKF